MINYTSALWGEPEQVIEVCCGFSSTVEDNVSKVDIYEVDIYEVLSRNPVLYFIGCK